MLAHMMTPATSTFDPIELIDRLDADTIRVELDRLYEREAALRAALKIARQRQRQRQPRKEAAHA
jgi:hypothetical protein